MTVGEKIKIARNLKGITQKELSEMVGVSYSMVRQYEVNMRKPKEELLQKFANALDTSIEFLKEYNIKTDNELMHFLFNLEIEKGLILTTHNENNIEKCYISFENQELNDKLINWHQEKEKLSTTEQYNSWKINKKIKI